MARCYRKVIRIRAEDSPNVRLAFAQIAAGLQPTGEELVPGVLSWDMYQKRRATWDPIRQCIGLDGCFWEGSELLLFPPDWLNKAEWWDDQRKRMGTRKAKAIGVDPAEGGDKTAMSAVDEFGLIECVSRRTPNTNDVPKEAKAFAIRHGVPAEMMAFDRGGGGKQHADRMRDEGWNVRTVAFGETLVMELKRGKRQFPERLEQKETQYTYVNRRAQMYGDLSEMLDPDLNPDGFSISSLCTDLRHQLAPIPKMYDQEGRLMLPPKSRKGGNDSDDKKKVKTLIDLIGHSPDEADSLVLAVHAMLRRPVRASAGAAGRH